MSTQSPGAVVAIWNGIAEGGHGRFYEWHEREHMPERVSIPGFLRGRRYRAVSGGPEFFTRYDLESPDVLTGEAYLARLDAPTDWTLRTLPYFRDTSRALCLPVLDRATGSGAWLSTIRVFAQPAADLSGALVEALPASDAGEGLIRLLVLRTDPEASAKPTREKASRPSEQALPDFTVLVEARDRPGLESASGRLTAGLAKIAALRHVEIAHYLLEFDILA